MQEFFTTTQLSWSVERSAERLDCSPRFVWGLIAQGKLPSSKIGRRTFVQESDLVKLLESHVRVAKPAAAQGQV